MRVSGADDAVSHLAAWSSRGKWREKLDSVVEEHLGEACRDFDLEPEQLDDAIGRHHYEMVMGCVLEDFFTRRFGAKGVNVVDDYLDHRGWREPRSGRDYLRTLRDSVMSLYEVVDLTPGRHLVLKDLIRGGESVTVDEHLGSLSGARWDRLGLRVLPVGDRRVLSGTMLHFPHGAAESVQRVLREGAHAMEAKIADQPGDEELKNCLRASLLANAAHVLTRIYLTHTLETLRQPAPQLVNFDGDEIVFTTVRFPVALENRAELEQRLNCAQVFERDVHDTPRWTWKAQAEVKASNTYATRETGMTFGSFDEHGDRISGHVELQAGELVLRANSVKRAERGKALLTELLGALIGEPQTSTESIESAIEESRAGKPASSSADAGRIPLEEKVRILHSYLDQHYRRSLDEPIPMVGDVSPREAVRGGEGREKVVAWLKYLENAEDRRARSTGEPPFDFTWMWQELGILDWRR